MLDFLSLFINLSNQVKMYIRYLMLPVFLLISGLCINIYSYYVHEKMAQNVFFNILNELAYYFSLFGLLVMTLSILILFWRTFILWKWESGNIDNCCQVCGGIVSEKHGRWGAYYKCLACGNNHH